MRWLLVREDGIVDWSIFIAVVLAILATLGGCCSHKHATTYDRVHFGGPDHEDMTRRLCVNCGAQWNEVTRCAH